MKERINSYHVYMEVDLKVHNFNFIDSIVVDTRIGKRNLEKRNNRMKTKLIDESNGTDRVKIGKAISKCFKCDRKWKSSSRKLEDGISDNVIEFIQENLTSKRKNKIFGSGIFYYNGIAEKILSANAIKMILKLHLKIHIMVLTL